MDSPPVCVDVSFSVPHPSLVYFVRLPVDHKSFAAFIITAAVTVFHAMCVCCQLLFLFGHLNVYVRGYCFVFRGCGVKLYCRQLSGGMFGFRMVIDYVRCKMCVSSCALLVLCTVCKSFAARVASASIRTRSRPPTFTAKYGSST